MARTRVPDLIGAALAPSGGVPMDADAHTTDDVLAETIESAS
jgi:hypothetical protein